MSVSEFLIILPVKNGGHYVRKAIESVLAQTVENWKMVILENFSTDDTISVIESYKDSRISLISSSESLGIYDNWNRAFGVVKDHDPQTIVTFLGHDDYFSPNFLKEIQAAAAAYPDATIYQTLFDLIDAEGSLIRACRPIPNREDWFNIMASLCWALRDSYGTGYAFRAKDYVAVGGMPDLPMLLYSDHLLFTRLTRRGYKVCVPINGFAYRLHHGSTSGAVSKERFQAHADALILFMGVLHDEFAEFTSTDLGQAAVASLLGRELFLLETPFVLQSLASNTRAELARLQATYQKSGRGVPMTQLYGAPSSASRSVYLLRRINLMARFLKTKLTR